MCSSDLGGGDGGGDGGVDGGRMGEVWIRKLFRVGSQLHVGVVAHGGRGRGAFKLQGCLGGCKCSKRFSGSDDFSHTKVINVRASRM